MYNYNRGRPWVAGVVQSTTGPLSYTIKLNGWEDSQLTLGSDSETLQSERHEREEPEDILVEPIHLPGKPCSRAMVSVSPGEPEEWDVAPDLPEQQQHGVGKQIEQDAMVPSLETSTEPEDLETHMEPTRASNLGVDKKSDSSLPFQQQKKVTRQTKFLLD